jgi:hypothetical protein
MSNGYITHKCRGNVMVGNEGKHRSRYVPIFAVQSSDYGARELQYPHGKAVSIHCDILTQVISPGLYQ